MPEPFALAPARWIWLEPELVHASSVLLFRREFELDEIPKEAGGWILAARYRLWMNGRRVQSGPAPADPRHLEADPVDLKPYLQKGRNAIGIEALSFEEENGPHSAGWRGLIARFDVGEGELCTSRENWRVLPDPARISSATSGNEGFDSRLHPHGWNRPDFAAGEVWSRPRELDLNSTQTPFTGWPEHFRGNPDLPAGVATDVTARSIPLMREEIVRASALIGRGTFRSLGPAEHESPDPLSGTCEIVGHGEQRVKVDKIRLSESGGVLLTYELPHGLVGWPQATIDAPAGTVVEFLAAEDHDPARPWFGSTRAFRWRWISRGREEAIEPFEYAGFRYLQIRIPNAAPGITIRAVGARRRENAFSGTPVLTTDDQTLQSLFDMATRTVVNTSQDLVVRGTGPERAQSAGEGSHQLHPVRTLFGGVAISRRFLSTFATGQAPSGVWPEAWPPASAGGEARKETGRASVESSIGFVLDHYHHWMHSGDLSPIAEHWPRFERLFAYLREETVRDGLLPAPWSWSEVVEPDQEPGRQSDEERCAANLYLHHMLGAACEMALVAAPSALADLQAWREWLGSAIEVAYFRASVGTYVTNAAEFDRGEGPRFDARALAHHLLAVPPQTTPAVLERLIEDARLGRSDARHGVWTFWALARHGAMVEALGLLQTQWAGMSGAHENGTISWPSSLNESRNVSIYAAAPLILAHGGILGLRPLKPGYTEYEIEPNLGGLNRFETVTHTPAGALRFRAELTEEGQEMTLLVPRYGKGRLILRGESHPLRPGMREAFTLPRTK